MYRSTRSPTLLSNQIAHGASAGHVRKRAKALLMNWRRNQTLADEAVDEARLIEGHEAGDRFAVVSHGYFLAFAHDAEIAAEVVSEFLYASFHSAIMASFAAEI